MEWKPIESAPRDGSAVLLLINGMAVQGKWLSYFWYDVGEELPSAGCGCCAGGYTPPTHWAPLPEMPDDTHSGHYDNE